MATPVRVHQINDGLPSNPMDRLTEMVRARSYQNAYIRAGWQNWGLALEQAKMELASERSSYKAKVEYYNKLQDLQRQLEGDLAKLETDRVKNMARNERTVFQEHQDNLRQDAREFGDAARTAFSQNQANARANLSSQTTLQRVRPGAVDELKNPEFNQVFVTRAVRLWDPKDPTSARRAVEALRREIASDPYSDKRPEQIQVSIANLVREMIGLGGDHKAIQAQLSEQDQQDAMAGALIIEAAKRGWKTPGEATAPGGAAGEALAPGVEARNPGIATRLGAPPIERVGDPGSIDTSESDALAAEERMRLENRIREVQAALQALDIEETPEMDLIGRAREIYGQHFRQGRNPKPAPVTPVDPARSLKVKAAKRAKDILALYNQRLENPEAQKEWTSLTDTPIFKIVGDLFAASTDKTKPETIPAQLKRLYGEKPAELEEAMTAYLLHKRMTE